LLKPYLRVFRGISKTTLPGYLGSFNSCATFGSSMRASRRSASCMRRWTLPSRAERGRVILSDAWTTSVCYKLREIERSLVCQERKAVSPLIALWLATEVCSPLLTAISRTSTGANPGAHSCTVCHLQDAVTWQVVPWGHGGAGVVSPARFHSG